MASYGVWYKNRSTPATFAADSAEEARRKGNAKKKKGYGEIVSVRELKGKAARDARAGKWVRERVTGDDPNYGSKESKLKARRQVTKYRKGLARVSRQSLKNSSSNFSMVTPSVTTFTIFLGDLLTN